jgi:hypothetical protein
MYNHSLQYMSMYYAQPIPHIPIHQKWQGLSTLASADEGRIVIIITYARPTILFHTAGGSQCDMNSIVYLMCTQIVCGRYTRLLKTPFRAYFRRGKYKRNGHIETMMANLNTDRKKEREIWATKLSCISANLITAPHRQNTNTPQRNELQRKCFF